MTAARGERQTVFGFQPSSYGFGWVAFTAPFSLHDWGLSDIRHDKHSRCLDKIETLFERFNPHTLVLEAFAGPTAKRRSARVVRLCRAVVALAHSRGIDVAVYSRADVVGCFVAVGAKSRHDIACSIARTFGLLKRYLPARRAAWDGQRRRMALFDAAAVVLTHYQRGAQTLFDDLSAAAGI